MHCKHYPQWMFCHRGNWAEASVTVFYDRSEYRQRCQQGFFSIIKQQSSVELELLKARKQFAWWKMLPFLQPRNHQSDVKFLLSVFLQLHRWQLFHVPVQLPKVTAVNLGNGCVYSLPALEVFRVKLFFFLAAHWKSLLEQMCLFPSSEVSVFWIKLSNFFWLVCLWLYFQIADDIANFEVSFCISNASSLTPKKKTFMLILMSNGLWLEHHKPLLFT